MLTVSIVGVGRMGGAIARSLPGARYSVEHLIGRGDVGKISSDIVFITTQDGEIEWAAKELVAKGTGETYAFHTSGSLTSAVLNDLKTAGWHTGSIHPLVSISQPELGPERFRGAFFCVEGDKEAVEMGKQIAKDLGGKPFTIATEFKTLYHAAAVTACGHLVALLDAAIEIMTKCALSPEQSKEILMPLVLSTVQNLETQSTAEALTGTFARADSETFTRHLTALNANVSDDLMEVYLLLGERSLELAARRGISNERIDTLRTKVLIAKSKLKW